MIINYADMIIARNVEICIFAFLSFCIFCTMNPG